MFHAEQNGAWFNYEPLAFQFTLLSLQLFLFKRVGLWNPWTSLEFFIAKRSGSLAKMMEIISNRNKTRATMNHMT